MPVQLNHTIVWCADKRRSAAFLARMLGRPDPQPMFRFMVVTLDNGVSLDFAERDGPIAPQHYAFTLDEAGFDAAFARVRGEGLTYWADPGRGRPGELNDRLGGRGCYFDDPDGHQLEIMFAPDLAVSAAPGGGTG